MRKLLAGVLIFFTLLTSSLVLLPSTTYAAQNDECHRSAGFLGLPTWYEYLEMGTKGGDKCAITGPTDSNGDFSFQAALPRIALAIVEILLRVAGMVAIGYVIFGGFKFMTSQGEPDATKQAQGTVTNALIGLAIAILATTIVGFVGSKLW